MICVCVLHVLSLESDQLEQYCSFIIMSLDTRTHASSYFIVQASPCILRYTRIFPYKTKIMKMCNVFSCSFSSYICTFLCVCVFFFFSAILLLVTLRIWYFILFLRISMRIINILLLLCLSAESLRTCEQYYGVVGVVVVFDVHRTFLVRSSIRYYL